MDLIAGGKVEVRWNLAKHLVNLCAHDDPLLRNLVVFEGGNLGQHRRHLRLKHFYALIDGNEHVCKVLLRPLNPLLSIVNLGEALVQFVLEVSDAAALLSQVIHVLGDLGLDKRVLKVHTHLRHWLG